MAFESDFIKVEKHRQERKEGRNVMIPDFGVRVKIKCAKLSQKYKNVLIFSMYYYQHQCDESNAETIFFVKKSIFENDLLNVIEDAKFFLLLALF